MRAERDAGSIRGMPVDMNALCDDLAAEQAVVDGLVAGLDTTGWATPTPAEGWAVRDQIAHLAYFDRAAVMAATDPDAFQGELELALSEPGYDWRCVMEGQELGDDGTLAWWRTGRERFHAVFRPMDPKHRVPWYGPPMSAASKVTARIMECWAHGQDVADALGATRPATDRLRHVAHIGVGARPFSYLVRGKEAPAGEVRVELRGPSGDTWTWGPDGAADVVRGSALDFCLLVTQRRHLYDLDVTAEGPLASEWLSIAQAFAGPPGTGRKPGQFAG